MSMCTVLLHCSFEAGDIVVCDFLDHLSKGWLASHICFICKQPCIFRQSVFSTITASMAAVWIDVTHKLANKLIIVICIAHVSGTVS